MPPLHAQSSKAQVHEVFPGAHGRFIHGEAMTVATWTLEVGSVIPEHRHPHEQIVNVLSGEFEMKVGTETFHLTAGDGVVILSGVLHSGIAKSEVKCIDVFAPVREDYKI